MILLTLDLGRIQMSHALSLDYIKIKDYTICPSRYKYSVSDKSHVDDKNTFYHNSMSFIYKSFYSSLVWSKNKPIEYLIDLYKKDVANIIGMSIPDDNKSINDVINTIINKIPIIINSIKYNKLVSINSLVDYDLSIDYILKNEFHIKFSGNVDFVHNFSDRDTWIFSAESSKRRDKVVDPDLLIYQAFLYSVKHKKPPSRVGSIHYSFPNNPTTYIELSTDNILGIIDKSYSVARDIHLGKFPTRPSGHCFSCRYKKICDDGSRFVFNKKAHSIFGDDDFSVDLL